MNAEIMPFPPEELQTRLEKVRGILQERQLDACVVTSPENIFYLTGLDHFGYFAPHILIVPKDHEMRLVVRQMEQVAVHAMLKNAKFVGYLDHEHPADHVIREIKEMGIAKGKLAMEKRTMFAPLENSLKIYEGLAEAVWEDFSDEIDKVRMVKSPFEMDYIRRAGKISTEMMKAAAATFGPGVGEHEIAAEINKAMCLAGGDPPGFWPFVRSTPTMGMEHVTWNRRKLENGDKLFIEMSGAVKHYHAPMGRLFFLGDPPPGTMEMSKVCIDAFNAVIGTLKDGVRAADVYEQWQNVVDDAGLSHYTRHHCGYMVGIGFPPGWVGGSMVVGLRRYSDLVLKEGMVFHILSWLIGTGKGDYLVTNAAAVGKQSGEVLIDFPMEPLSK
jgi:Xaa-Pro dipeptidase